VFDRSLACVGVVKAFPVNGAAYYVVGYFFGAKLVLEPAKDKRF
jgi:hypothetical protein